MSGPSGRGELVTIELHRFPVAVWARADEEQRDLLREFELIALGNEQGLPARLLQVMAELEKNYGGLNLESEETLRHARDRGASEIDYLAFVVPQGIEDDLERAVSVLDEADAYCREGEHLLSLASSPAARALREWLVAEIRAQLSGGEPTPWPDSDFARQAGEHVSE